MHWTVCGLQQTSTKYVLGTCSVTAILLVCNMFLCRYIRLADDNDREQLVYAWVYLNVSYHNV